MWRQCLIRVADVSHCRAQVAGGGQLGSRRVGLCPSTRSRRPSSIYHLQLPRHAPFTPSASRAARARCATAARSPPSRLRVASQPRSPSAPPHFCSPPAIPPAAAFSACSNFPHVAPQCGGCCHSRHPHPHVSMFRHARTCMSMDMLRRARDSALRTVGTLSEGPPHRPAPASVSRSSSSSVLLS